MQPICVQVEMLTSCFRFQSVQGSMSMPTYVFMNVERTDSSGKSMEVCANFYPNLATMNGALPMARNLKEAVSYGYRSTISYGKAGLLEGGL